MNNLLLPKRLKRLRDTQNREVEYDVPRMIFAHGTHEGVLEHLVLSLLFRGGGKAIDKPYYVRKIEQPLTYFFAGQLAINDVSNYPLEDASYAAQYLASEHVLIVPSKCSDKLNELQAKFETTFIALKNWKAGSASLDDAINSLHETIVPRFGVPPTRLRIPEIIGLFNCYLSKYNEYKERNDPVLTPHMDELRRDIEKSIQDTKNSSIATIVKLADDFEHKPTLRIARLIDVFTLNHLRLDPKASKEQFYGQVLESYDRLTRSLDGDAQISAYASLIVYDILLNINAKETHLRQLQALAPEHPKATFMENLVREEKKQNLWASTSKLSLVGLEPHYHPDLLAIMVTMLTSYGEGRKHLSPFPVDRVEDLVKYATKTRRYRTYCMQNSDGDKVWCLEFNQDPIVDFKGTFHREQQEGSYVICVSANGNAPLIGTNINDYHVKRFAIGKPTIDTLLATSVDRYLLRVPVFRLEGPSPGARWITMGTRGY